MRHELVELVLLVADKEMVLAEDRILGEDVGSLGDLSIDTGELIDRGSDTEASHVSGEELVIEGVHGDISFKASMVPHGMRVKVRGSVRVDEVTTIGGVGVVTEVENWRRRGGARRVWGGEVMRRWRDSKGMGRRGRKRHVLLLLLLLLLLQGRRRRKPGLRRRP